MLDNGCPTPPRFPASPFTVPVTQCQMGSESSADPPLCGEKPPELQLQATGYWSRHEKFTADINKSESKARVTRSPPPPFWSQQGEKHTLGAGAPNYSGCVEWKRKKLQTEEGEDQTAESPSALEKGESGLESQGDDLWHSNGNGKYYTGAPSLYLPFLI